MVILINVNLINHSITYIGDNPKDFINICFWIFTAIIALITYNNAKKTLFNPIRSEMVKYQMKIITEFVDKHTSKGYDFDASIDYSNLLKLNYETDYLFEILTNETEFEDHTFNQLDLSRLDFCKKNLGGLFEIKLDADKLILEPVSGDFYTAKQYIQTKYIKDKEDVFKHLFLQRLYLTKKFYEFYSDLLNLKTNPFIPDEIKTEISTIISNIYTNIGELYKLLSVNIMRQTDTNYQNIYAEFTQNKIDHKRDIDKLRGAIANYFKVNSF